MNAHMEANGRLTGSGYSVVECGWMTGPDSGPGCLLDREFPFITWHTLSDRYSKERRRGGVGEENYSCGPTVCIAPQIINQYKNQSFFQ